MRTTTKALLFRLPAGILLLIALLASVYVKAKSLYAISWAPAILLLIILILYFIGENLSRKGNSAFDF